MPSFFSWFKELYIRAFQWYIICFRILVETCSKFQYSNLVWPRVPFVLDLAVDLLTQMVMPCLKYCLKQKPIGLLIGYCCCVGKFLLHLSTVQSSIRSKTLSSVLQCLNDWKSLSLESTFLHGQDFTKLLWRPLQTVFERFQVEIFFNSPF